MWMCLQASWLHYNWFLLQLLFHNNWFTAMVTYSFHFIFVSWSRGKCTAYLLIKAKADWHYSSLCSTLFPSRSQYFAWMRMESTLTERSWELFWKVWKCFPLYAVIFPVITVKYKFTQNGSVWLARAGRGWALPGLAEALPQNREWGGWGGEVAV